MPYAVKGGIGDFLQCLPFMLAHPDEMYYVATHFNDATLFFGHFGISVKELSLGHMPDVESCPRQLFFDSNPFPSVPRIFSGRRPVVGVHLGASNYSLSVEERFGFPPKALPLALLKGLVSPDYDILVFGSSKELDEIKSGLYGEFGNLKMARGRRIIDSLAHVSECSMLIGSDSAFKTMSAMLRIPTAVLVGDYADKHRDERFIYPYRQEGIMSVFCYENLTDEIELRKAVRWCCRQLEATCLTFQM